jgi:hypothetical protein
MSQDSATGVRAVQTEDGGRIEMPVEPPEFSFRAPNPWVVAGTWLVVLVAAAIVAGAAWAVFTGGMFPKGTHWWPPTQAVDWWMAAIDVIVRLSVAAAGIGMLLMFAAGFFPTFNSIDVGRKEVCQRIRNGPFRRRPLRVATDAVSAVIVRPDFAPSWSDAKKLPRERSTRVCLGLADGGRRVVHKTYSTYPAAMEAAAALASHITAARGGAAVDVIDVVDPVDAVDPLRPPPPGSRLRVERTEHMLTVAEVGPPPLRLCEFRSLGAWCVGTCLAAAGLVLLLPPEITREEKLRLSLAIPGILVLLGVMLVFLVGVGRFSGVAFRVEPVSFSRVSRGLFGRRTKRWNRVDVLDVSLDQRFGDAGRMTLQMRLVGGKQVILATSRDELKMGYLATVLRDALGMHARKK